jgi:hypothetical protein
VVIWQAGSEFVPAIIAFNFYVQGEVVVIEKLGHRDGFYEE